MSDSTATITHKALAKAGSDDEIETLRKRLARAISHGQTMIANFTGSVRRQAGRADKAIRAKPYHAIGIATGAALIAGFIISRSRRGSR